MSPHTGLHPSPLVTSRKHPLQRHNAGRILKISGWPDFLPYSGGSSSQSAPRLAGHTGEIPPPAPSEPSP